MANVARALEHSYRFLLVAGFALAGSLWAHAVFAIVEPPPSPEELVGTHGTGAPHAASEPARHLELRRDVFCSSCGSEEPRATERPIAAPQEACAAVHLHAIVASSDDAWSFAALQTADGTSVLRRKGGQIGEEEVAFIGRAEVWMQRHDGTLCLAKMFAPPADAVSPPPPVKPAGIAGVRQIDPSHLEIDRGVVEKATQHIELLRGTPMVPAMKDGRVTGMKVMRVAPESLLEALGIRAGDELRQVNGYDVTNPQNLLEAYARLPTIDHVKLVLEREGKPMQIDYDVK